MTNKPKNILELPEMHGFYEHPFIKQIAQIPKWSISDIDKRPIDINTLKYEHRVMGCNVETPFSMDTLTGTIEALPFPANHAYYLNAPHEDSFVVLDVEPACPSSMQVKFLDLPYIYAEKSMSGKGLHIIMPLPSNYEDFPIAARKIKLQEEHRWYEILVNHWVTFTRNMLPPARPKLTLSDWDDIYAKLAEKQKASSETVDFEIKDVDIDDIPDATKIVELLVSANTYKKTSDDFNGDMSRFEYGMLSFKCKKMLSLIKSSMIKDNRHDYTPDEIARMLFHVGQLTIPYRQKHDETRQNLPWLLFVSRKVVGDQIDEEE